MTGLVRTLLWLAIAALPAQLHADEPAASRSRRSADAMPLEIPAQRVERLRELAEAGEPEAQSRLAILYRTGSGVEQSDELAFAWMRRAAEAGDPAAQHYLGLFYLSGIGTEINLMAASKWLRRCAEINQPESVLSLAWFTIDEHPVGQLAGHTAALVRNGAEHGATSAEEALEFLRGEHARAPLEGERSSLREAANAGLREAQYQLGVALMEGRKLAANPEEATHWLLRAAEGGDPRAMRRLGVGYLTGRGVPRSSAIAYQWFWLAQRHGDSMATQDVEQLDQLLGQTTRERARRSAQAWEQERELEPTMTWNAQP